MAPKNTSIYLTLLTSVFMMMFVASLFHLPDPQIDRGLISSFFMSSKVGEGNALSNALDRKHISTIPQDFFPQE